MDHGFLVWLLAVCIGLVGGAMAYNYAVRRTYGELVRVAAAIAGFIIGFALVYIVASHL